MRALVALFAAAGPVLVVLLWTKEFFSSWTWIAWPIAMLVAGWFLFGSVYWLPRVYERKPADFLDDLVGEYVVRAKANA